MISMSILRYRAALMITVCSLSLQACGGGGSGSESTEAGKLQIVQVPSAALGGNQTVKVYTPPGYDGRTRYPVLYMYHGLGANENQWMPTLGLNSQADLMLKNNQIHPLIIVAPKTDNSYGAGGWEQFISSELIQYIDANFSTNPTRENRFIGGLSMGGFIALHHAFVHSDVFSKVGGHSPYLYTLASLNSSIENPIVSAGYRDLRNVKVYLDTGDSDQFNLTPTNAELTSILKSRGITVENNVFPGGHTGIYWSSHVPDYLKFYVGR